MKSFDEILAQLIINYDCVIIPNFGGFVTKASPSKIDYEKGIMTPPSKQVLFNVQLLNNDGLLNTEISTVNSISFAEAKKQIECKVAEYHSILKEGKKISIQKIGTFQRNQEGIIVFEQDRFFNFLIASYGLNNVQFIPVEPVSKPHKIISEKRNTWKYAAAACLLPIAFYSFWIPLKTNVLSSEMISINDFNPFHKKSKTLYNKKKLVLKNNSQESGYLTFDEQFSKADHTSEYWLYQFDKENTFAVANEKADVINENELPQTEQKVPVQTYEINEVNPSPFNCIAGCFSNKKNAVRLVNKLKSKGYNATLLTGGELYRVSIGGGFSEEGIIALKSKANHDGLGVWILH